MNAKTNRLQCVKRPSAGKKLRQPTGTRVEARRRKQIKYNRRLQAPETCNP